MPEPLQHLGGHQSSCPIPALQMTWMSNVKIDNNVTKEAKPDIKNEFSKPAFKCDMQATKWF